MCENEIKERGHFKKRNKVSKAFVRTEEVCLAGAYAGAIMAAGTERAEGSRNIA